jgi:hypothetical protein
VEFGAPGLIEHWDGSLSPGGRRYDGVRWNIEPLGAQLGVPGAGWFAIYGSGIFQSH